MKSRVADRTVALLAARTLIALLAALAVLAVSPGLSSGQGVSYALGAGWYEPGGEDFDETDGGFGYHGSVGLPVSDRVEVALGAQWSIHEVDFSTDDYDVVGVYVEPRVHLAGTGAVRPYLAGRLAWVRQSIAVEGVSRASNGVGGAAELGAAVGLGPRVELEGGLSLGFLSFGDFETDAGTLEGSDSSGRALGVRVGVRARP